MQSESFYHSTNFSFTPFFGPSRHIKKILQEILMFHHSVIELQEFKYQNTVSVQTFFTQLLTRAVTAR